MMKKCGSCYWYKNKWNLKSGVSFSCSELQTKAEDTSCKDFRSELETSDRKTSPELVLSESREALNYETPLNFAVSQKDEVFNIISDIFTMEQDVHVVIEKIKDEIKKQGYEIPFSSQMISSMTSKLSTLYLLHRMTTAFGMGSYMDEIMKHKIEQLFADPRRYQAAAPQPQQRSKAETQR